MTRTKVGVNDIIVTILVVSLLLLFSNYSYSFYKQVEGSSDGSIKIGNESLVSKSSGNASENTGISMNDTNSVLIMETDRSLYVPGEPVNITISNTGGQELTFPNSALGLTIRNALTNETYPIFSAQVITTLNPGDSKSITWDQIGVDGKQVPKGDYVASLGNEESPTENVVFSIS
jgi:hypothetical protein